MGWHPQDEDFTTPKQREKKRGARYQKYRWNGTKQVAANWYGFITKPFRITPGRTNPFLMRWPDRIASLNPASSAGRALRVASIDIGGGTTDMAIVHYQLDDGVGANVKITPHLLFREGFKVAGTICYWISFSAAYSLPCKRRWQRAGVTDAPPCWRPYLAIRDELILRPFCASKRRCNYLCRWATRYFPPGSKATLTIRLPVYMRHLAIC
ncbi:putative virulence factor [Salmonella enterica subsp. enterica]|uniref:Putative virulence factor n=1 Tax=Salmonella enterica I TaxID=59201 RepID=A0A447MSJ3_SALET|nr:putative virulence factor [Salmonella enterica subsp. enterica]